MSTATGSGLGAGPAKRSSVSSDPGLGRPSTRSSAEEEEGWVKAIGVGFLEAYPFPAFVVAVRTKSQDTRTTEVLAAGDRRPASRLSSSPRDPVAVRLPGPNDPVNKHHVQDSKANPFPHPNIGSGLGDRPNVADSGAQDDSEHLQATGATGGSPPMNSSHSNAGQLRDTPTDAGPDVVAARLTIPAIEMKHHPNFRVQPGSRPVFRDYFGDGSSSDVADSTLPILLPSPKIVWANKNAVALTQGNQLAQVVEEFELFRLQLWAESDGQQDPSKKATPSTDKGPVFSLVIGVPPVEIDVAKTYLPSPPDMDSNTRLVLMTATGPPRTPRQTIEATTELERSLQRLPTAIPAGPVALHNMTLSATTTSQLIEMAHPTTETAPATSAVHSAMPSQQAMDVAEDSQSKHPVVVNCCELLRQIDFTNSPMGPYEQWPMEVKSLLSTSFSAFTQDCVYIGTTPDELCMIYNQKYSYMLDHPKCFGQLASVVWAPIWPTLRELFVRIYQGEAIYRDSDLVLHQRNTRGRYVERYQSYSLLPIFDLDDNSVVGVFNPSVDSTDKILADRRLETTRTLIEQLSLVRTGDAFFHTAAEVLERNPADAPFLICYSVHDTDPSKYDPSSPHQLHTSGHDEPTEQTVELHLHATVGVPKGHHSAPNRITMEVPRAPTKPSWDHLTKLSLNAKDEAEDSVARLGCPEPSALDPATTASGTSSIPPPSPTSHTSSPPLPVMWPFARALATRMCVVVDNCRELVKGYPVRQWDELPDMAIVIPLSAEQSDDMPPAVFVMGLNLYRPLDSQYEDWIQVMRGHLTSALGSTIATEEELNILAEKEKFERVKSMWYHGSANEVRSPLALIAAPLEDLQETQLSSDQKAMLSMAVRNVHKLQGIVSNLLEFSRMEAGHINARFTPTVLGPFVTEIVAIFNPIIESLKTDVRLVVDSRTTFTNVDPALLEMAVSHMLVEALKQTKSNSLSVHLSYDDQTAKISVVDTDLAIWRSADTNMSDVGSINDWFSNDQEKLSAHGAEGRVSALALALTYEIARLHHGQLTISGMSSGLAHGSKGGPMSALTIRIPLNLPAATDVIAVAPVPFGAFARQTAREVSSWTQGEDDSDSTGAGNGSLEGSMVGVGGSLSNALMFERDDVVLVVDDNRDGRSYIKRVFSSFCTVIAVRSSEARRLWNTLKETKRADLVICDQFPRSMSMFDLLDVVRADTKFTPFIVLSASNDDRSRMETYMAGVDDFITKPFSTKELLLRVHLHLQMGKKRAKLEALFANQLLESDRRRTEAEDSRRHQEFMVDVISHEIRTPVSAILQCSSLVKHNLSAMREKLKHNGTKEFLPTREHMEELNEDIAALDSIYQCGLIQERIAGDVLSLARIQSKLLSFHNISIDLKYEINKVVSVFSNEARMKKIELGATFGSSLDKLGIRYIQTDPVRIGQVITNLISNAIRFTSSSLVRKVNVHLEASWNPPASGSHRLPDDLGTGPIAQPIASHESGAAEPSLASRLAHVHVDAHSPAGSRATSRNPSRSSSCSSFRSFVLHQNRTRTRRPSRPTSPAGLVYGQSFSPPQTTTGYLSVNPLQPAEVTASSSLRHSRNRDGATSVSDIDYNSDGHSSGLGFEVRQRHHGRGEEEASIALTEAGVNGSHPTSRQSSVHTPANPNDNPSRQGTPSHEPAKPLYLFINVSDSGPGINEDERVMLFQRFRQGNDSIHTRFGGSGLGLFICKSITHLLGGSVTVESEVGTGSTFRLYVKVGGEQTPPEPSTEDEHLSQLSPPPSPSVASMPPLSPPIGSSDGEAPTFASEALHILIVEDNLINQTVLKRQLLKTGFRCDVASNGQEALAAIKEKASSSQLGPEGQIQGRYDVVLMDLEMPVMDGLTALRHIREAEGAGKLPKQLVVALTGNAREGQKEQALAQGMNAVVLKPYRLPQLVEKVRQLTAAFQ